jgi:Sporulation protein Cse60
MKPYQIKYRVKGFESDSFQQLVAEVDQFVHNNVHKDHLIDIKYNNVPLAIATHTEYGVYPDVKYTAMVIYLD